MLHLTDAFDTSLRLNTHKFALPGSVRRVRAQSFMPPACRIGLGILGAWSSPSDDVPDNHLAHDD